MIGTTSTEAKAAKAKEAGADEVILYSQTDFVEEVNRITDGKGVNAIYDGVGKTTFLKSKKSNGFRVLFVCFESLLSIHELNSKRRQAT